MGLSAVDFRITGLLCTTIGPVGYKFFSSWPGDTGNRAKDFEGAPGPHGPVPHCSDASYPAAEMLDAGFKSFKLGLIDGLKNKICARTDQMVGSDPPL